MEVEVVALSREAESAVLVVVVARIKPGGLEEARAGNLRRNRLAEAVRQPLVVRMEERAAGSIEREG